MTSERSRKLAIRTWLMLPIMPAVGCEFAFIPIGQPFSKIEFDQRVPCPNEELPAYIAVTRQDDGAYLLELSEFEQFSLEDADDQICTDMGGWVLSNTCYVPADVSSRELSAEERQQVDEVLARLIEVYIFIPMEQRCAADVCGGGITTINGRSFFVNPCPLTIHSMLTDDSRERLLDLWISLRD